MRCLQLKYLEDLHGKRPRAGVGWRSNTRLKWWL